MECRAESLSRAGVSRQRVDHVSRRLEIPCRSDGGWGWTRALGDCPPRPNARRDGNRIHHQGTKDHQEEQRRRFWVSELRPPNRPACFCGQSPPSCFFVPLWLIFSF